MTNSEIPKLETDPFPHIVLDNLFPTEILENILKEVDGAIYGGGWRGFDNDREKKFEGPPDMWGPTTYNLYLELTRPGFIAWLQELSGVRPLTPDFLGGGYHVIPPGGGKLGMHVDFNLHPQFPGWHRKINLLTYLNKDWKEEYGGQLKLGRKTEDGTLEIVKEILPVFGRTVMFVCSEDSWHGHPEPLTEDAPPRKSFAAYFYTPQEGLEYHDTLWGDEK